MIAETYDQISYEQRQGQKFIDTVIWISFIEVIQSCQNSIPTQKGVNTVNEEDQNC